MDFNAWLAETVEQAPCGPDLEYDPEFTAFEQLARGRTEQQFGETVIAAEGPDWRAVERSGTALFKRTKDLRVVSLVARAWVHLSGIQGLADGLALTRGLLERYWDAIHPQLEFDGEFDSLPRANALAVLGSFDGLLGDLRRANLLQIPGITVSVSEAEIALGGMPGSAESLGPSREQLSNILAGELAAGNGALRALLAAREDLEAIRTICIEHLGAESAPDLSTLCSLLDLLARPLGVDENQEDRTESEASSLPAEEVVTEPLSEVNSRKQALRALELVRAYIERNEPANPAALFILRAEKMMTMGFLDIIRELAPDSLGQLEVITGARQGSGGN